MVSEKALKRTMLTFYMVYARWAAETPRAALRQAWQATPLWGEIYRAFTYRLKEIQSA